MNPTLAIAGQRSAPGDLIFVLVAVLWLGAVAAGKIKLRLHAVVVAVIGFAAAMVISAIFSGEPCAQLGKLAGVGYLAAVAIVTFQLVDRQSRLRLALLAFLIGATIPAVVGIVGILLFYLCPLPAILYQITHHYGSVPVGNFPRLSSTFVSPSMFMNYLSVAIVFLIIARIRAWLPRSWFVGGMVLFSVCCVFTVSIGIGALFLIIGFLLGERVSKENAGWKRAFRGSGIIIALMFLAISPFALQPHSTAPYTITEPLFGKVLYPSARSMVWEQAIFVFRDHPVTGIGIGLPVAEVAFQNTDGTYSLLTDAHNSFLSIAAQTGIIGLLALLSLSVPVLRCTFRRSADSDVFADIEWWLGIAFLSAFLYQGMTGSFEDARHIWLLVGLIPAASAISKERKRFAASEDLLYS